MVGLLSRRRAGADEPRLALVGLAHLESGVDGDVEDGLAALDLDRRLRLRQPRAGSAALPARTRDVAGGFLLVLLLLLLRRLHALDVLGSERGGMSTAHLRLVGFGCVFALLLHQASGFGLCLLACWVNMFPAVSVFDNVLVGRA